VAEVRVLLDPGDEARVSVGLLERHDPARGHVVVHPTPGARSLQAFAHDVLGALGRAVNRLDAEQLAGPAAAWRAVTAWMVTSQTGELVVLRADRLRAGVWARLLALGRETGTRLLLVCHAPQIPAQLAAVLAGTGHQVLTGLPRSSIPAAHTRIPGPGQMRQPEPRLTPKICRASSTRISATTAPRHSISWAPPGSPGRMPSTGTPARLPATG
jgi:hypothetical protein